MPQLTLWDSFTKRANSTKRPSSAGWTVNAALKQNTSLSSPTFLLAAIPPIPSAVDYAQFEGRFYFVTDIVQQSNHAYELHCTIDPLATYKDAIAAYTTFVERSTTSYNDMIPDAAISQSDRVLHEGDIVFDNSTAGSSLPAFDTIGCFILRTVSADGINGYAMSWNGMRTMLQWLFTDTTYDPAMMADSMVRSFFNPFQYIIDVKWFPLDIQFFDHGSNLVDVGWGWWASSNIRGYTLGAGAMGITGEVNLTEPAGAYTDFRRVTRGFTEYNIYLPGVGVVPLEPDVFAGEHPRLECSIDYKNGSVDWNVVDVKGYGTGTQEHVKIAAFRGQIGVPVQIGQMNNDILGGMMKGLGTAASLASGNWLGALSGAFGAVQQSIVPQASINGTNGSMIQLTQWPYPTLSYKIYESGGIPGGVYGRPLYQNRQLGTLSGYVKCSNASIDISGFSGERDAVNAALNNGFYME